MKPSLAGCPSRRAFLAGAGAAVALGGPLAWYAYQQRHDPSSGLPLNKSVVVQNGMPGKYPRRVVEVLHPDAVNDDNEINGRAVRSMMAAGMRNLTGADHPREAWKQFFQRDDVIGIKVNPVGRKSNGTDGYVRDAVGSISSFEVLLEVVAALRDIDIPARNILVFERYADEFRQAGYEAVLRERVMAGVRWFASATRYHDAQVALDGYDGPRDRDAHVVGYDRDHYVHMGFCAPQHDRHDDRRFRSHTSNVVTRLVNKFITVPVLKDHRSAGVTLSIKNMSHGMNNNVARSHINGLTRLDGAASGPNQCNTFIPTAVLQPAIRQKATLHILDGLIGVYEGGPGAWNRTWRTWRHKGLFFATDPVSLDLVGWQVIDRKRLLEGWPSVASMGQLHTLPELARVQLPPSLAMMAVMQRPEVAAAALAQHRNRHNQEAFDRRQPEHILLTGINLGMEDAAAGRRLRDVDHRVIRLPG